MLRYVYGHDRVISKFVAGLVPHVDDRGWEHAKGMGVINEAGELIAGVVWYNYSKRFDHIEVGAAAIDPRWFTRETIRRLYGYPFDELGCQVVYHITPVNHHRVLRILQGLGCEFAKLPRIFGRSMDGMLCTLTEEVWRRGKVGQRLQRIRHREAA